MAALVWLSLLLLLASPAALAAKKASGPPVFEALPFSFTGSADDATTHLPQNDLLVFLNGTAGASGMIQVSLQTTSGSVSLQACAVEICFRSTATLSGRKPQVVNPDVASTILVAGGELSDAVPWWFWIRNDQAQAAASGTLTVTLVPTVVVNSTSDSVDLSVGGGELRLIKVEARADAGAALQVSFTEATAAGSFQFFAPSDTVLPVNTSLSLFSNSYLEYFEESSVEESAWSPFNPPFIVQLFGESAVNMFGPLSPPAAQPSGSYYLANNLRTDNATWWVVAGSRNQQAANATLSFKRVVTQPLSDNTARNFTASQIGELQIAKLPAAAGRSGQIRTNLTLDASAYSVVLGAGLMSTEAPAGGGVITNYFAGSLSTAGSGAQSCAWDDNTDWWFVVTATPSWTASADDVQLAATYIDTINVDGGVASSGVSVPEVDDDTRVRLVKVSGAANVVGLRVTSRDTDIATLVVNSASYFSPASTICGGELQPWSPSTLASGLLTINQVYLSRVEAQDWYLVVAVAAAVESNNLVILPIVAQSLALGSGTGTSASQPLTLGGGDFTYGHDVQVVRVEAPANATADELAGLQVTYTVARLNATKYPGQSSTGSSVPQYITSVLNVFAGHDYVVPALSSDYFSSISSQFATGGQASAALSDSEALASISTTGTVWTDELNLLQVIGTLSATERRIFATTLAASQSNTALVSSLLNRRVADDAVAGRVWYVVLVADLSAAFGGGGGFEAGVNFTLPLTLTVQRAAVLPLQSGLPVISPAPPSNPGFTDPNVPATGVYLYKLPAAPNAGGLASLQILQSASCQASVIVSPSARTIGDSDYYLTPTYTLHEDDLHLEETGYTFEQYSVGSSAVVFRGSYSPARALRGEEETITTWLQAADSSDGAAWYITAQTQVNTPACSFALTLHDTVLFQDDATDEYGALRWTADGVPVSPLSQTLFKLPGRLALRGLISDVSVFSSDDGSLYEDTRSGPLAFTMQAQSVPNTRAGTGFAYRQLFYGLGDLITAGSLFTLPFAPLSWSSYARASATVSTGAYVTSATGLNNDQSDVFFLGVSRTNATTGTRVVDVAVTVGQTRALCNDKVTCNDKGKCLSDGSCNCDSGYGGQFCSCKDSRDCSGHGICALTQGCVCDSGYSGADCSRSGAAALVASAALALVAAVLALVA